MHVHVLDVLQPKVHFPAIHESNLITQSATRHAVWMSLLRKPPEGCRGWLGPSRFSCLYYSYLSAFDTHRLLALFIYYFTVILNYYHMMIFMLFGENMAIIKMVILRIIRFGDSYNIAFAAHFVVVSFHSKSICQPCPFTIIRLNIHLWWINAIHSFR